MGVGLFAPGRIASIYRYPVKSMAGERLQSAELTPDGLAHDRLYAFESAAAPPGMLRVSGAQRRELLQYSAHAVPDGVRITTPTGQQLRVEDPELLGPAFTLTHEPTPQTDVRPLALISLQSIAELAAELGEPLDPQRFRANLLLDLPAGPFAEDALAGRTLRLGATATVLIRERTPRCRFITYDPVAPTRTDPLFALMKLLDRRHGGRAGVYASVLVPGNLHAGDPVHALP